MGRSTRICSNAASKSQTSFGTSWKCHLIFPVSGSSATMLAVYRLSPLRFDPSRSEEALPTPQYKRFNSASNDPVIQVDPPPYFQVSPFHVLWPASPGPGMV